MIDTIRGAKGELISVIPQRQTLEDLFVRIVQQEEPVALPEESR